MYDTVQRGVNFGIENCAVPITSEWLFAFISLYSSIEGSLVLYYQVVKQDCNRPMVLIGLVGYILVFMYNKVCAPCFVSNATVHPLNSTAPARNPELLLQASTERSEGVDFKGRCHAYLGGVDHKSMLRNLRRVLLLARRQLLISQMGPQRL